MPAPTFFTFCTCCLREGLDPWSDTDEGYTHCCNDRLGYDVDELRNLIRNDLANADLPADERAALATRLANLKG